MIMARRFVSVSEVPKGRPNVPLVGMRISRPFGTCGLCASDPGVETPGWAILVYPFGTARWPVVSRLQSWAEKTRRTLKPHFYFVVISELLVLVPSDMIA